MQPTSIIAKPRTPSACVTNVASPFIAVKDQTMAVVYSAQMPSCHVFALVIVVPGHAASRSREPVLQCCSWMSVMSRRQQALPWMLMSSRNEYIMIVCVRVLTFRCFESRLTMRGLWKTRSSLKSRASRTSRRSPASLLMGMAHQGVMDTASSTAHVRR